MKSKHISDALEGIDFDMVEDAGQSHHPKRKSNIWLRWAAVAACLALITGGIFMMLPFLREDEPTLPTDTDATNQPTETQPYDGPLWVDERPRNNMQGTTHENAIIWPWNCLEIWEQYIYTQYGGITYRMGGVRIDGDSVGLSPQNIGEKLADGEAYGYDEAASWEEDAIKHTIGCEVYAIKGIPSDRYIAIKYDGYEAYFRMFADEYNPPATLGDLISELNLTENCPLNTFYDYSGTHFNSYGLTKDSSNALWEMFMKYADVAVQREPSDSWSEWISFSLTSEELDIYNLSWSLWENGWLVTNLERYGYYYYLGPDAVAEITAYALAHKTEHQKKPTYSLVGVITEVGEDYIKIDDTIMMENPEDGMIFTVYAGNSNIKKYLACGYLSAGQEVMVTHKGIYAEEPTVVRTAISLYEVWIEDTGEVWIPE